MTALLLLFLLEYIVDKFALFHSTVGVNELAVAVAFGIPELAFVPPPIGILEHTVAAALMVRILALVDLTVGAVADTSAMAEVVLEIAFVTVAVAVDVNALAVSLPVCEITFKVRSSGIIHHRIAVPTTVKKLSFKAIAVLVCDDTLAVTPSVSEFSFIPVTVRIFTNTEAMNVAIQKIAFAPISAFGYKNASPVAASPNHLTLIVASRKVPDNIAITVIFHAIPQVLIENALIPFPDSETPVSLGIGVGANGIIPPENKALPGFSAGPGSSGRAKSLSKEPSAPAGGIVIPCENTITVEFIVSEFTLIPATIGIGKHTGAVLFSLAVLTLVNIPIGPTVLTITASGTLYKIPLESRSIRILFLTETMGLTVFPDTHHTVAVRAGINAAAAALTIHKITLKGTSIGHFLLAAAIGFVPLEQTFDHVAAGQYNFTMSAEFAYIKLTFIVTAFSEMQNTLSLGSTKGKITLIYNTVHQLSGTLTMGQSILLFSFIGSQNIHKGPLLLMLHHFTSINQTIPQSIEIAI